MTSASLLSPVDGKKVSPTVSTSAASTSTPFPPLAHALPFLLPGELPTLTAARKACRRGEVLLNGIPARQDASLKVGDVVEWTQRDGASSLTSSPSSPASSSSLSKNEPSTEIEISVAYEDDHLAVVSKPRGLPTQGAGPGRPSLQKLLMRTTKGEGGGALLSPSPLVGALWRPRPVHRLDSAVGGLVLIAKTRPALAALSAAFGAREVATRWLAAVSGRLPAGAAGRVAAPLDGSPALTSWRSLGCRNVNSSSSSFNPDFDENDSSSRWVSVLEVQPLTGRPQQLRRHLEIAGHPLLGPGGGERFSNRKKERELPPPPRRRSLAAAAAAVAAGAAARILEGAASLDEDDHRDSAATARARMGRRGRGEGRGGSGSGSAASASASRFSLLESGEGNDLDDEDETAANALSGSTAVDRFRADAASRKRAEARDWAAAAAAEEEGRRGDIGSAVVGAELARSAVRLPSSSSSSSSPPAMSLRRASVAGRPPPRCDPPAASTSLRSVSPSVG